MITTTIIIRTMITNKQPSSPPCFCLSLHLPVGHLGLGDSLLRLLLLPLLQALKKVLSQFKWMYGEHKHASQRHCEVLAFSHPEPFHSKQHVRQFKTVKGNKLMIFLVTAIKVLDRRALEMVKLNHLLKILVASCQSLLVISSQSSYFLHIDSLLFSQSHD